MNFIVVSPHFPRTYWNFCDRLKKMGVRVLGIGDAPYDSLAPEVTRSLDEYYYLPNMESYEEMRRAVAFFASKYGRIHWIESNNEYWLEQDARLRQDFNIKTGVQPDEVRFFKSKAEMKIKYAQANVPTARCAKVENWEQTAAFLEANASKLGGDFPMPEDVYLGQDIIAHAKHYYDLHGDALAAVSDEERRKVTETIGYYAMFRYINGFEKVIYWPKEKMKAHALQYSAGYANDVKRGWTNTFWSKDFDSMAKKTMLRQLISKWGVMSVEMQNAYVADNHVMNDDGTPDYSGDYVEAGDYDDAPSQNIVEAAPPRYQNEPDNYGEPPAGAFSLDDLVE